MLISTALRERGSRPVERLCALGLGCALIVAGPALAAPGGEVDNAFGNNGRVTITLNSDSIGWAVAQQADGKLVLGGATSGPTGADFAIIRLNADGSRDNGFGTNGVVTVDFAGFDDIATSLIVQGDGKIVAAGLADVGLVNLEFDLALVRLNTDGSLDSTFDGDGRVTRNLGGNDEYIAGAVLLGNGQIVVGGSSDANGDYDAAFARFNADGSTDANFGTGGTTFVDSNVNGGHDLPFWITQQPDGKFIACGLNGPTPGDATGGRMLAVRVNADGSVDTGYGVNGVALVVTGTALGTALSCVATPGGTVLAGFGGILSAADLALARLDANGVLDTTFGIAGQSSVDLGGTEIIQTVILLSDGRLGVTGLTSTIDDNIPSDMYFARFDTNGSLDATTFGNNGVTILDFGEGGLPSNAEGLGLIEQTDGKLVAVGTRFGDFDNGIPDAFAVGRVDPAGAGSVGVAGFVETFATVVEGSANVILTVRRTGGGTGPISVEYNALGVSAQAPGDFTATSGTLNWISGDMAPQTIAIPITDDTTVEGAEGLLVTLTNAMGGAVLAATEFTVAINDNDVAPPPPPPPPPSGGGYGGGGGGTAVLELLALLGLLAFTSARSRRRSGARR